MYYINRADVGQKLVLRLKTLNDPEPVVVSLKESSLSCAISIATHLRGWVFPLLCEEIKLDGDDRILGAVNSDGEFTVNPALSHFEYDDIMAENHGVIEDKKRQAFASLNRSASAYPSLDLAIFNGRTVILCGDILQNQLTIEVAKTLLKPHTPKAIIAAGGNVDVDVADLMRLTADKTHILDVMSSMFDEEHYFEKSDVYSMDQLRQIASNITQFWQQGAAA